MAINIVEAPPKSSRIKQSPDQVSPDQTSLDADGNITLTEVEQRTFNCAVSELFFNLSYCYETSDQINSVCDYLAKIDPKYSVYYLQTRATYNSFQEFLNKILTNDEHNPLGEWCV